MLISISAAYTGKALHTHSGSYYDALMDTRNEASKGMSDNCPICHFNLIFFLFDTSHIYAFYTELLTVIDSVETILRSNPVVTFFSLRAPPVLL